MSSLIYLRPLKIEDAQTSYKWRNDPDIWTHTGFVPVQEVTPQIEKKWLSNVLIRADEKRYAVCIKYTHEYIGNVQLRHINENTAEFELFIGEKKYWGKGIGYEATRQLLQIAFTVLELATVYLYVKPSNNIAIRCYNRAGFKFSSQNELIKMVATSAAKKSLV